MVTCDRCATEANEGASVCPQCGYSAEEEIQKTGTFLLVAGLGICLTAVGAIVGVPLIYFGIKTRKEADEYGIDYDAKEYSPW
ncbi:DUF5362 family protein [Halosegnis longus]|uniref:Uncharacterized protein n=1 Tax=Halosegnis longus TaxID=2216012 RepID=A0AAJ4R796_9EURY|nr:hypothetical protein Nmn1133_01415 [Salella cibi]